MNYTTQMDAARRGIVTKEMEIVAKKEQMDSQRRLYSQASAGNKERDSFTARQNIFSSGGKGRNCRLGCV